MHVEKGANGRKALSHPRARIEKLSRGAKRSEVDLDLLAAQAPELGKGSAVEPAGLLIPEKLKLWCGGHAKPERPTQPDRGALAGLGDGREPKHSQESGRPVPRRGC